jgi:hypothetical protein
MRARNDPAKSGGRPTRFLKGAPGDLAQMMKLSRLQQVKAEILAVQPGLSEGARTQGCESAPQVDPICLNYFNWLSRRSAVRPHAE